MRRRKRHKKLRFKKLMGVVASLLVLVFVFEVISMTMPFVSAAASKAAILSASITMPEGGKELLDAELSQTPDEDSQTSMTAPDEANASKNSTESNDGAIDTGIPQQEIDSYNQNNGPIVRKTYTAGEGDKYINIGGGATIYNTTNVPNQTALDAANTAPSFTIDAKSDEPQVLIMHTHTTETYELAARDFYDNRYNARTRDQSRNVIRVGDEITRKLKEAGIGVIHDTTEHDYPSYNGSYDRSKATVESYLAQYPSIKVVLDIHRDAITADDGTRYAPINEINGKNAAQVMIISGCDDGTMNYPNYLQNLSFASALERTLDADYPGLARPVAFKYKYYNQSLTTGSLLIEVGSFANSLEEAIYAGQLLGDSLVHTLQDISK